MILIYSVPLPCIMSEWTAWTKPDASGTVYRVRYVVRPSVNGGKECEDLLQLKKGIDFFYANNLLESIILSSFDLLI